MSSSRGKILVIRGGAIGDFILTLPALAALRAQFSQARLEILGYPHIADLAVAGGLADAVQAIASRPMAGFFARRGELAEDLADYFSGFDIILSYLYDPDQIFQTNVRNCTLAQFIVGPHRPDENSPTPAAQVFLKPLERLAIFEADPVPRLNLPPAVSPNVAEIALHPGSGSETKNWPEANWAALLDWLMASTSARVLLVGGEAEGDRLARLAERHPGPRLSVAQNLPLVELGRRLQSVALFVGHDSGISHLAAALGLPGLILWANSTLEIWRPPSPRFEILRYSGGLARLPVEIVSGEVARLLRYSQSG